MHYLSVETSCGWLWVAYREAPEGLMVCFSLLGVEEEQFVAECRRRLHEVPRPAPDSGLVEGIRSRLDSHTPWGATVNENRAIFISGPDAELSFDLAGRTDFQRDVLTAVAAIPRGQVRTYAEVAASVGRPRAARAVGEVMRTNPIPVLIPCHRVVRSGGQIGNYTPHPDIKRKLLIEEGAITG